MIHVSTFSICLLIVVSSCNGLRIQSKKTMPTLERLPSIPSNELGEGPHWDVQCQSLFFVDIFGKSIHKYVPATKRHTQADIGIDFVSFIIPISGYKDKFIISIGRQLAVVTWNGESKNVSNLEYIAKIENNTETLENSFNDAKCDPVGRLWAGTMGELLPGGDIAPEKGALYRYDNGYLNMQVNKVGISNGLAWRSDGKKMYYVDTQKETVDQFDYDIITGKISNRKILFTVRKHNIPGRPDGMTIDSDNNLWVAMFTGGRILKISTQKPESLLQVYHIPAKQVTSVTFGGPKLQDLYVTTGKISLHGEVLSPPENGGTFRITGLGITGTPGVSVRL